MDTSAWLAVMDEEDRYYRAATAFFEEVKQQNALLLTSDYIMDETLTRLRYDLGHRSALYFLSVLDKAIADHFLIFTEVDQEIRNYALSMFKRYADQKLSFTDCTSVIILQTYSMQEIFTFDRDFLSFGFILQPFVR